MIDVKRMLTTQKVKFDQESFAKEEPFIRAMIHFEIDSALFGMDEARRNLITKDPQAQFALTQFGEAERLLQLTPANTAAGVKGR
jgi:hypothetical protein